jgi:hypothetical protein
MDFDTSRTLGTWLGILLLLFGVYEVVTHRSDTAGALAFWGLSLLGGGALVLAGTALRSSRRTWGLTLLTVGALAGANATLWTLVVPLFALVTLVAAFRDRRVDLPAPGPTAP